ncbi:dual adapter for phosphotyrosine and 3-phosphotyrosine and 3-phosphoinositide-like isoform X2 [Hippocampus comes]|uniref:dual adapter for phosphotyrosine and 3-phosphotyrosine and 3-phosphoinositide-like isoform X2 n=1 Tax=Hippocampus comes TaxID=109280 RepID=UPI00094E06CB|nr:PREDICTED: dual adapter for phosphotyrosine and 3-phosphotyrosine and 3-phosphoinositide-like isoform X2 [Hippocampus comes]
MLFFLIISPRVLGTLIVLKYPYPWRVEEPSIYESVRVHTALQTGRTENDLVPNAPSLGTKEGYLLKQGAVVKYEEPIRTLDLKACSAVQFDYSQERINCFCLVFPERTFYLCAKTGVEADEWIKILRWKLVSFSMLRFAHRAVRNYLKTSLVLVQFSDQYMQSKKYHSTSGASIEY